MYEYFNIDLCVYVNVSVYVCAVWQVFDHPVLSKLSFQDVHDQLNRTSHAIFKVAPTHSILL